MILAAGLGTRLQPYTLSKPKPLFPIAQKPLLAHVIERVIAAGVDEIVVNCHHQHHQVEAFLDSRTFDVPVHGLYEPTILGTGGALKNAARFWDASPILIVNGDIWFDIDLNTVGQFHQHHPHPVTLVLTDDARFNLVAIDAHDSITGIHQTPAAGRWTFTGIHVMDAPLLDQIPPKQFHHITDLYRDLIHSGTVLKAFVNRTADWQDIGTPESYVTCAGQAASLHAQRLAGFADGGPPRISPLSGDGSDRIWYRVQNTVGSLVMATCGIQNKSAYGEYDAFLTIGQHLRKTGISVPAIVHEERFPGLVFLEDLGSTHLQDLTRASQLSFALYQPVVDLLVKMWFDGAVGFTDDMPFQTIAYDEALILEKECAYFVEAFVKSYCGIPVKTTDLQPAFDYLAREATASAMMGFMHRDFQSRNLMYHQDRFYVIDFQGARRGPLQYDLASLLIDPYVDLAPALRQQLAEYCLAQVCQKRPVDADQFWRGFAACGLTRNLQILGAFGFLTRVKCKPGFEQYIPAALQTLAHQLGRIDVPQLDPLKTLVDRILESG